MIRALNRTLKALEADGRLTPADEALVDMARGLARALAQDPKNAALWREYRMAIELLMRVEGAGDDGAHKFWLELRTPVVDAADAGPAKSRSGRGDGGAPDRPRADAVAGNGRRRRPGTAP